MASGFLSSTRRRGLTAALMLALTGAWSASVDAPAALAAPGVTVQTVYENTPISVNMSDAVGYEFANNTGTPETVSFTDLLPYGVTVDNPAALTNTGGTVTCVVESSSANPGATSVALSVQVPSSSSSGVGCTISVGIVPGSPSQADTPLYDGYTDLSATPHTSSLTSTAGGLVVLADPTLSVTAPQAGQVFALGQLEDASFGCSASDPLDSVNSFFGTDDLGNQIASGEPIDTVDPGNHTLDIECYSAAGGGYVSQTVAYSVGSYTLTQVRTSKAGQVSFRTLLPAGKLVSELLDGTTVIGSTTTVVSGPQALAVKVVPSKAGLKVLKAIKGPRKGSVRLALDTSFTPTPIGSGDAEISPTAAIKLTRTNLKVSLAAIRRSATR